MRFLLDTHVLIWAWLDPERLPGSTRDIVADLAQDISVSAVSLWEISIKQALGKLKLPGPAAEWAPQALDALKFATLNITARHALAAGALPRIHDDPFDRMLIAQAREENMTLVTADPVMQRYETRILTI